MSRYPTYVMDALGRWWKDPVFTGDGWFICFDEDEPTEIVVKFVPGEDRYGALKRILELLKETGAPSEPIPGTVPFRCKRSIGDAWQMWIPWNGPMPLSMLKYLPAHKTYIKNEDRMHGTYIGGVPKKFQRS